jgi:hypothetical protein
MNVSTSQLAQPLPPERWIVCSDPRRDAIKVEIKETTSLYVAWRLRHGLVGFVSPKELATALRKALDGLAPQVHVFHNLGSDEIHQWLGAPPDRESRRRLRIRRLTGLSVAPLVSELSRPDGLVEAEWLFNRRQLRPRLANPGQDESFIKEEASAFEAWREAFVAIHGATELDEVYGGAQEAEQMPNPAKPELGDLPPVAPVLPFPLPAKAPRSPLIAADSHRQPFDMDLDSLPLAASSEGDTVDDLPLAASSEQPAELPPGAALLSEDAAPHIEWLLYQELRPDSSPSTSETQGAIAVYSGPVPGDSRRRSLQVRVGLEGRHWAGRDELVLALVPRTQRPLLLRLSKRHLPAGEAWLTDGDSLWREITLWYTVDQSVADALRGGTAELHDFTDDAATASASPADGRAVA